jgi:hypothetical protein
MNCRGETLKIGVPLGIRSTSHPGRTWQYVAGCEGRGRPEGRLDSRAEEVIHETSGVDSGMQQQTLVKRG